MNRTALAAGSGLAALPATALAHTAIEGIDIFYSGLLQPLYVPSHLLSLLALAMLCGLAGRRTAMTAIPVLSLCVALGLAAGSLGATAPWPVIVLLVVAMSCGALAALAVPPMPVVAALAAAVAGMTIGLDSVPEAGSPAAGNISVMAATWFTAWAVPAWLTAVQIRFARPWVRLGARIVGSWILAAALMVLVLALKP
ncbi:MAG: HupE/UreJ family protein [Pseudomonadota bacterium]|nr:HupE/UreJ family protein [Pseudomonadota bacterium]